VGPPLLMVWTSSTWTRICMEKVTP
jgi:hypothetical protein